MVSASLSQLLQLEAGALFSSHISELFEHRDGRNNAIPIPAPNACRG